MQNIAILRGINVGGHNKLKMADLKESFRESSITNITTYIQSGNLIFTDELARSNQDLQSYLENHIKEYFKYDVPVIVRTAMEWKQIIQNNEYANQGIDIKELHLTFLSDLPQKFDPFLLDTKKAAEESYYIRAKEVYLHIPSSYHKSKLSNNFFEKVLQLKATTRNWKTVLKIAKILED